MTGPSAGFVYIWTYTVKVEHQAEFERAYGPDGEWAQFFSHSPDYLGTDLIQDVANPLRYLTLDHWTTQAARDTYRHANQVTFTQIDERCEHLTESETLIGDFEVQ